MKSTKIIYWITTGLFSLLMLFSAYSYIMMPQAREGFAHIGFPDFFRKELAVAKFLGALVLLIPGLPPRLKEWAYAGFTITLVSAVVAHVSGGDGPDKWGIVLVVGAVLGISYIYYHRLIAQTTTDTQRKTA